MLTDIQIKALRPTGQQYRVPDGNGLHLSVAASGEKSWVLRYKLGGHGSSVGLGSYPEIGLKMARMLRDEVRAQVAAGKKPKGLRAMEKAERERGRDTVAEMVWAWFESEQTRWSEHFRREVQSRLEQEVIGPIGTMPAADVTVKILLDKVLEPLKARSHDIAQRVRQHLDHAFAYGMAKEMATTNPAAMARTSLGKKPSGGHRPALIELPAVRDMMETVEAQAGFPQTKLANRFMALTAMRPGEVRFARWEDFEDLDSDKPIWRVPEDRMKMKGRGDHLVPLSAQAVDVIREAHARFGRYPYVFPHTSKSQEALCENVVGYFINRAGYAGRHSAHGWRSAFSTVMNDRNPADADVIEAALAHEKRDQVAGRYNRGTYLERRRALMQTWADLLLDGMPDAETICSGPKRSPPIASARRIAA